MGMCIFKLFGSIFLLQALHSTNSTTLTVLASFFGVAFAFAFGFASSLISSLGSSLVSSLICSLGCSSLVVSIIHLLLVRVLLHF